LLIDLNSRDLKTPFIRMIVEKWKKEVLQENLLEEDLEYIEETRINISNYFYKQVNNYVLERMKTEFKAKYLGDNRFEIFWKEKKYEFRIIERDEILLLTLPSDKLIIEINKEFVVEEMEISISSLAFIKILTDYIRINYERTTEYKLKSIYN
jgi:hypothetical protein